MGNHETFELGLLALQCGLTLPRAHLAYKTTARSRPIGRTSFSILPPMAPITPTSNGLLCGSACSIPSATSS